LPPATATHEGVVQALPEIAEDQNRGSRIEEETKVRSNFFSCVSFVRLIGKLCNQRRASRAHHDAHPTVDGRRTTWRCVSKGRVDLWHNDAPSSNGGEMLQMVVDQWAWWWGASNGPYGAKESTNLAWLCASNGVEATNDRRMERCPRALSKIRRHNWQS